MFKSLSPTAHSYLLIHFCVVLWGFTSIFGRLITLDALALTWWRMLIGTAVLMLLPTMWRQVREMSLRLISAYCAIGVLLAVSWVLFYQAIKLSDASVGAICMGVAPLFLALIEPALTHRRFSASDLVLGIGVIPGIALIIGGIPAAMYLGFGVGLSSMVFLALFTSLNKRLIERAHPLSVTCIELGAGAVFLTLVTWLVPHSGPEFPVPHGQDLWLLLILALVLTLLPIVLMLIALRHISAFAQQIATNLEPVYAVLLAIPILGEQQQLGPMFYAGVIVIVGTVVVEPLIRSLRKHHLRPRVIWHRP